ncbi:hypothetical protein MTO96_027176 [Rhipicephalus appendiculatus]
MLGERDQGKKMARAKRRARAAGRRICIRGVGGEERASVITRDLPETDAAHPAAAAAEVRVHLCACAPAHHLDEALFRIGAFFCREATAGELQPEELGGYESPGSRLLVVTRESGRASCGRMKAEFSEEFTLF